MRGKVAHRIVAGFLLGKSREFDLGRTAESCPDDEHPVRHICQVRGGHAGGLLLGPRCGKARPVPLGAASERKNKGMRSRAVSVVVSSVGALAIRALRPASVIRTLATAIR